MFLAMSSGSSRETMPFDSTLKPFAFAYTCNGNGLSLIKYCKIYFISHSMFGRAIFVFPEGGEIAETFYMALYGFVDFFRIFIAVTNLNRFITVFIHVFHLTNS